MVLINWILLGSNSTPRDRKMKAGRLAEAQNAAGDLLFDRVHRKQCVELHELRESPKREFRIGEIKRAVQCTRRSRC